MLQLRPERVTQNRVVKRLIAPASAGGLGYANLGDWSKRDGNRCIESDLLRYGVPVQVAAGVPHETVHLIDWDTPRDQGADKGGIAPAPNDSRGSH